MPEQFRPEPSSSSAESMPSFLFEDNFEETSLWERLSTYSDGEADEYEQEDIERLLQSDPILARELNFLNTTHHLLSNIEEVAPPVSLRQSILVATSQRPTLRRRVEQLLTTLRQQPTLAVWGRYAVPVGAVALIVSLPWLGWILDSLSMRLMSVPRLMAMRRPYQLGFLACQPIR